MKILLISNYRPDRQQSMLRYPRMLEAGLSQRGHEVTVAHPPAVLGRLPFVRGGVAKWIRYIDKYAIAPLYLGQKARQFDVVHICDHSNAMYLRCVGRTPHVITCHDLIAMLGAKGRYREVKIGATGRLLQRWISNSLEKAKNVICVSRQTETDLRLAVPDCEAKVRVIPHALNRRCERASEEQVAREKDKLGLGRGVEYLLHVGGNDWYKNRLGAVRIFAELRKLAGFGELRFVMAGRRWSGEMREFAESSGLREWILEAEDVGDDALNALYSGAAALLFPSLTEGFGWPIPEAQACGCPVITTNRAPMTEVAGAAAIYIDPTDAAAAAKTIAEEWPRREALREAGFQNAAKFTAARMIDEYLQVYEQVACAAADAHNEVAR